MSRTPNSLVCMDGDCHECLGPGRDGTACGHYCHEIARQAIKSVMSWHQVKQRVDRVYDEIMGGRVASGRSLPMSIGVQNGDLEPRVNHLTQRKSATTPRQRPYPALVITSVWDNENMKWNPFDKHYEEID